ncbi:hypothetical protein [Halorussus litoreus]|uniref:hypothetical protein n=1 Tax=Halorussus litoreus TaxID=1710536 RepID=UPI001E481788|nr:hypothetical protein [Halorussus litoreus]
MAVGDFPGVAGVVVRQHGDACNLAEFGHEVVDARRVERVEQPDPTVLAADGVARPARVLLGVDHPPVPVLPAVDLVEFFRVISDVGWHARDVGSCGT